VTATLTIVTIALGAIAVLGSSLPFAPMSLGEDIETCMGFSQVSAGTETSLAIGPGGTVWGWGANPAGQLGDGTTVNRHNPTLLRSLPGAGVTSVATGGHSLAVGAGGTVWSFGDNSFGQLGDGSTTSHLSPEPVRTPDGVPLAGVAQVATGNVHSLARDAAGRVYAWGDNRFGQLGDETVYERRSPVVLGVVGAVQVAAGWSHSLALDASGTVHAWGTNSEGQLGDGTTTGRLSPVVVSGPSGQPLTGVTAIAAGWFHSLAIGPGGTVFAWGSNFAGQLGDGTTTDRLSAVVVSGPNGQPLSGITAITAGWSSSYAIGPGGVVYAWGNNGQGRLGDGTTINRLTAVQVVGPLGAPLAGVTSIAAGTYHTIAVANAGTLLSWGGNGSGELGDGTTADRHRPGYVVGCTKAATASPSVPPTPVVTPPVADPGTGYPSDDCVDGSSLASGFAGGTYVTVRTKQVNSTTTWVCARADGPALAVGGKFVVTGPVASPGGAPTTDTNADACATTSGNTVPGPHPALSGNLGDPNDPAYVPFLLDAYSTPQTAWVCVGVGTQRHRVVVPLGVSATPPMVTFFPDATAPHVPSPAAPATPSGTCQTGGGTRVMDVTTAGTRTYAYWWQPTSSVVKLCVRIDGSVTAGGVLTVDTTAAGGALPSVVTGTDTVGCDRSVGGVETPTKVEVRRSASTLPASVCLTVGATTVRVTASSGDGQPPADVIWTKDPDTP
jgi:alpha-tubulin suppressor-like RCC1 family protein